MLLWGESLLVCQCTHFGLEFVCLSHHWIFTPDKLVLHVFIRYVMEKVDLVIVGAEGVVESGGIINKVNSL